MNIIVVGCGKVGQTLAVQLNNDGNNITVIDTSAQKVSEVTDRHDIMGVTGNGAYPHGAAGGRDKKCRSAHCCHRL